MRLSVVCRQTEEYRNTKLPVAESGLFLNPTQSYDAMRRKIGIFAKNGKKIFEKGVGFEDSMLVK